MRRFSSWMSSGAPVQEKDREPPKLSKRAYGYVKEGERMKQIAELSANQYSKDNPDGVVIAGIAQNSILQEELADYFNAHLELKEQDFSYGDSISSSDRLAHALNALFKTRFNSRVDLKPDQFVFGGGLTAIIDQLTSLVCDVGEGILIAEPYYNGFNHDITGRSEGIPVGVSLKDFDDLASPATLDAFEDKLTELKSQDGPTIRAVILCSPHNPCGFTYPRETIIRYLQFVEKHDLHLFVDEIYALTTFANPNMPNAPPFQSILSFDIGKESGCDPSRVHCLYGASKDFSVNGLRIGVFSSPWNKQFMTAFQANSIFMKISSASDALWSTLLNDRDYLDKYIHKNSRELAATYAHSACFLRANGVPFREANSAMFIWMDLRKFLRTKTDAGVVLSSQQAQEDDLAAELIKAGIFIAPGQIYAAPEPGFFRLTFTLRMDYLDVALSRFKKVLDARR
ncbi:uncharacterized protein L969DRAFT_90173 [Mixia osmundae IAM 14324]|uniref:Aminotransferase class I/classII large domain-containing protein n=1 Tax=Mixia osmundae (strain CBS 9802 / IAM 14324 / JCM 22182 / KY 12970) TaxID=764103 RepID=G7DST8_MIXOS|nr:uncharacterized protein L969DRAFT_90173 [Mixia osmundae IAM 14324]KEI37112.1 hypothetical protein L969DRAFT_90173 [Mixia osmundae IAM 14324]GAA93648.1 hypothetical protein E5Q_00293 [Mixia osmundae IAM 14324]